MSLNISGIAAGYARGYSEDKAEKKAWMQERVGKNRDYLLETGIAKFDKIKTALDASKANIATAVKMGFTQQAAQALEFQGSLDMQLAKLKRIGESQGGVVNREALKNVSELIWDSIPDDEGREKILNYFTDNGVPDNIDDLQDQFIKAIINAKRNDADFVVARGILSDARTKARPDVTVNVPTTQNYQALNLDSDTKVKRFINSSLTGLEGVTFSNTSSDPNSLPGLTGSNAQEANKTIANLVRGHNESYNRNENSMEWLMNQIDILKNVLTDTTIRTPNKWKYYNDMGAS
jgi:hypothetical protein